MTAAAPDMTAAAPDMTTAEPAATHVAAAMTAPSTATALRERRRGGEQYRAHNSCEHL
jgi:hypothetical protein